MPEKTVPILSLTERRALLEACEGLDFEARRDTAIIRTFIDTGARLAEIAGLTVDDLDLDGASVMVMDKGRCERHLPIWAKTVKAIHPYSVAAAITGWMTPPWLWLGAKGRLTESGIAQMGPSLWRAAGPWRPPSTSVQAYLC